MGLAALQMGVGRAFRQGRAALETLLEAERAQLALWIPVLLGGGITAWFLLPNAAAWSAWTLGFAALALLMQALSRHGRGLRLAAMAAALLALGSALIWARAERVAHPVLARPAVVAMDARVERVEAQPARARVRLTLAPIARPDLPARIRVNLDAPDSPPGLSAGAIIALRARLMPPPEPAVPGAYDFQRFAWFDGLGATGRGFAPVVVRRPGSAPGGDLRARLSAHIQSRIAGSGGGIASALATGDRGAITDVDSQAMQRSGLAHLLSVSGLHVSAVTAAAMLIVLRLLALSPTLALRWRLPLVAAGAGALAAIGYTLLTGAEVPTVRSCVAALLVLLALSLGREAITLRLVAAGALLVLLVWPEALAGPSFQLSFAAVTAIVALHESPVARRLFAAREEGRLSRLARHLASLLLTGIVVEAALMPIAFYHFHQTGLYGALANIVAIPLTTFVVMPLEAVALLFDLAGLGWPFWWLTARALDLLLWIAHAAASAPGSMAALPAMPGGAYGLMAGGGLWLALWRTRIRWAGPVVMLAGATWALATPAPDLLVTGDGRHVALRMPGGGLALLRERTGDYARATLGENGGIEAESLSQLAEQPGARCSPDLCIAETTQGHRRWRILATRSGYSLPWEVLTTLCRTVDVAISERRLPRGCTPRWLKLDRATLRNTGGIAISLRTGSIRTVRAGTAHPWLQPPTVQPPPPERSGGGRRRTFQ